MNNIYAGTSGLVLPFPKKLYPPEYGNASRLAYYATLYNSIEINSSFYKMPRAATISKWKNEVPDHFRFTFKMLKEISHAPGLNFDTAVLNQFLENISHAFEKRGCLLIQFPAGFSAIHASQLEKLLSICTHSGWKLAVELRNISWYNEEIYKSLGNYNAAMVVHDFPASVQPRVVTSNFMYVRFHGAGKVYRGSYDNVVLQEYATYIRKLEMETFIYFNNTMGDALGNLNTLNSFLKF